jgi:hypothetical protein
MADASISACAARCNRDDRERGMSHWPAMLMVPLLLLPLAAHAAPPKGWVVEAEDPAATVNETHGVIDIDSAKGITLWSPQRLSGPTAIRFDAMAAAGGPNDKVSDLNAFWMATEKDGSLPSTIVRAGSRTMTHCGCITSASAATATPPPACAAMSAPPASAPPAPT